MKLFLIVAAMAASIPGWTAPDYSDLPPDLAKAALAYDEAQLTNDGAALTRLLADDYKLVSRAGTGRLAATARLVTASMAGPIRGAAGPAAPGAGPGTTSSATAARSRPDAAGAAGRWSTSWSRRWPPGWARARSSR